MVRARRSHAELDRLLDRLVAGQDPEATGDLAPFLHPARVARAAFVRSVPEDVARGHLAALRADRARNVVVPDRARARFRPARIALVATIVAVLSFGSALAASADALPGDPLYGLKRAAERISLAMHRDPVGKAALHLQFAQERLDELQTLHARGEDVSDLAADLEAELEAAEEDALNALALGRYADALLAHVQDMIAKHIAVLNEVLGKVPDQAKNAIQRAIDNAENAKDKVQHGRRAEGGKPDDVGKPSETPSRSGGARGKP